MLRVASIWVNRIKAATNICVYKYVYIMIYNCQSISTCISILFFFSFPHPVPPIRHFQYIPFHRIGFHHTFLIIRWERKSNCGKTKVKKKWLVFYFPGPPPFLEQVLSFLAYSMVFWNVEAFPDIWNSISSPSSHPHNHINAALCTFCVCKIL